MRGVELDAFVMGWEVKSICEELCARRNDENTVSPCERSIPKAITELTR